MSAVVMPIAPPRIAVSMIARMRSSSAAFGLRAVLPRTPLRAWEFSFLEVPPPTPIHHLDSHIAIIKVTVGEHFLRPSFSLLLLQLGIGVFDLLERLVKVEPDFLSVLGRVTIRFPHRVLIVVTESAALRSWMNQTCRDGLLLIFHYALGHVGLAGPVTGFTGHAILWFDFLRRHRFGEVVRGRMALETLAAGLRIIDAEFCPGRLRFGGAQQLEGLGVRTGLACGKLIARFLFLVTNTAGFYPDIIGRIAIGRGTVARDARCDGDTDRN